LSSTFISTKAKTEKALIVAVEPPQQSDNQTIEYIRELKFLAETAGAEVLNTFKQKLPYPNPKTYVGSGKLEEVDIYVKEHEVDLVIFDDDLSPSQIRNLEQRLKCKIIDRSGLILDIFARNARTATARAQVELAQNEYLLPRLTRMWTHLQKQKGGIGMKGPGEREIETDRRVIRDKIARLKQKLEELEKQGSTQRKSRQGQLRVALVGYTNVGKSTLMNLLSKAGVLAENKLFATLDSTVRKCVIDHPEPHEAPLVFLLSDTVGFIRKLPHQLVESFKSTLAEVLEADLLLHVVDVSHPAFEEQIDVVKQTLVEIGAGEKSVLMVFNKIDRYSPEPSNEDIFEDQTIYNITELKETWMARENFPMVFVSAAEQININELKEMIAGMLVDIRRERYPYM
jgi:GTP-binding protein HflX